MKRTPVPLAKAVLRKFGARPWVGWLDRPWMDASWVLSGPTNQWSIRVFAQRRSGHHAIINWLRQQIPGRHCFLNDCQVGVNPFEGARRNSVVRCWAGDHRYINWTGEIRGRHAKKGTLIHNYEDGNIHQYSETITCEQETAWIGESTRKSTILVLRDPYNLFASRLKWILGLGGKPATEDLESFRSLWKLYAREVLGITQWLGTAIHVRYNDWFRSGIYRDEVARQIGFVNGDIGINEIARWGPALIGLATSFDGFNYEGKAQQMKVLERWKEFAEYPLFRSLVEDEELVDLSARLFGEIEGVNEAVAY